MPHAADDSATNPTPFDAALAAIAGGMTHLDAAAGMVAEMTPDEKLHCLSGDGPFWAAVGFMATGGYHRFPFPAADVPRLGVTGFAFSDGPRGVVVDRATCFPVTMARGATWDVELEERVGEAIGIELRAVDATLFGGVCVNVLRHPAWGRAQETYGEDPHHVGEMGAAITRGVQRHAMACVKHFAANSMENARFRVDVTVDDVALHEVFLPQFRRIIDEGAASVMSAYNQVNGEWCGQSHALLDGVLRQEWGFEGFVISDWIFGLRDGAESVRAGLNVEMPYRMMRQSTVPAALDSGELDVGDVDRCVMFTIATLLRFADVLATPAPPRTVLACDEHRALAREVATRSAVLLRNEVVEGAPLLPLDPNRVDTVAVLGRLGDSVNLGDGGSSEVWAPDATTVAAGLRDAMGRDRVLVDDGSDPDRAAGVASTADVAVVVVGYTLVDEGEYIGQTDMAALGSLFPGDDDPGEAAAFEARVAASASIEAPPWVTARGEGPGFATGGDRRSLRLHDADVALIRAVAATQPRTVVVLVAGSAVLIDEWNRSVPAVMQTFYAGMDAGGALTDLLFGHAEPTGRLPFSVPGDEAHLPAFDADADAVVYDGSLGWWHLEANGTPPAYPFGFGLGYTTFEIADSGVSVGRDDIVAIVTIANTGARHGSDVVGVYAERIGSNKPRRLVGFGRGSAAPGDRVDINLTISLDRLAERDSAARTMVVHPGRYRFDVARYVGDPGTQHHEIDLTV